MPFIPHTDEDVREMLATLGLGSTAELFDEIPARLRISDLPGIPDGISEMEITRLMEERAEQDGYPLNFIGAGAYEHHIPAAVWEIATRGEFYTAYTPYQAEASQGTLQLIYEYQTMMASLTGMDVSNASMYDGASALAEAALMAVRGNRKSKSARILVPRTLNPVSGRVTTSIAGNQGLRFESVDFDTGTGLTPLAALEKWEGEDITAMVIQQPNFFGLLEEVDALTDWAHARGALVIAMVNPTSLALLAPPGEWGDTGADIVCGEGQPLGVPLSSGGPYFGFMACKQALVRQMPGRIVGRTVDLDGRPGFTLTLQAREQHIRRSKATSNICTNQGLAMTAATIYMSLLGPGGLERAAAASMANTDRLVEALNGIEGVRTLFAGPRFHEAVLVLDGDAGAVLARLAERNIQGGLDLGPLYPELGAAILVCATETKTDGDIQTFVDALRSCMEESKVA